MTTLTVALLQLRSHGYDQPANLAAGDEACRRAAAMGADLALFPEMWSIGYAFERPAAGRPAEESSPPSCLDLWRATHLWRPGEEAEPPSLQEAVAAWRGLAIPRDGAYLSHFRSLARELHLAIAVTYLEAWDGPGGPRNSVSLIDRRGELAMTYAKVHTCDFDAPEAYLTPGDDFYVCELDTAAGPVQTGAMICYDREFPESARILMLKGAEIILTPNACELEVNRLSQFRARAMENMVGLAMANYAGHGMGHSIAFDGIAFCNEGSRDMLLVEAGEGEGIYLAHFDLDRLREYRSREAWGNAFRRPHRYALLTSDEVRDPFLRVDARGRPYPRTER